MPDYQWATRETLDLRFDEQHIVSINHANSEAMARARHEAITDTMARRARQGRPTAFVAVEIVRRPVGDWETVEAQP